jgi:hypothetical protein
MTKFRQLAIGVTVALIAGLLTTAGNAAGTAGTKHTTDKHSDKSAAPKNETYAVVQIGDEMRVIRKSELTGLKKSTAEEDKKAKKDYDEAKKAAKTKEEKAELGKPPASRKVIVKKQAFKTEQEANDWIDQQQGGAASGSKKKYF